MELHCPICKKQVHCRPNDWVTESETEYVHHCHYDCPLCNTRLASAETVNFLITQQVGAIRLLEKDLSCALSWEPCDKSWRK